MTKRVNWSITIGTVITAFALWFFTFAVAWGNFWVKISLSAAVLCVAALLASWRRINWRGFLQENLTGHLGPAAGWGIATSLYALVHLPAWDFMLIRLLSFSLHVNVLPLGIAQFHPASVLIAVQQIDEISLFGLARRYFYDKLIAVVSITSRVKGRVLHHIAKSFKPKGEPILLVFCT